MNLVTINLDDMNDVFKYLKILNKIARDKRDKDDSLIMDFGGHKIKSNCILDTFDLIMSSNTEKLYDNNLNDKKYYVYAHCNPNKPLNIKDNTKHLFAATRLNLKYEPFYIGKGVGDRYLYTNRNDSYGKVKEIIKKSNKDIICVKIFDNLNESVAFSLEDKLIDIFGLITKSKHGILVNLDEGLKPEFRRNLYNKNKYYGRIMKLNGIK